MPRESILSSAECEARKREARDRYKETEQGKIANARHRNSDRYKDTVVMRMARQKRERDEKRKIPVLCKRCNTDFVRTNSRQKYCSKICRKGAQLQQNREWRDTKKR